MANFRKTVTHRLVQAARAHRTLAGVHLGRIGLHPGQEAVLKTLADKGELSMSALAAALGVQPPTVTKMVARLGTQGLVERRAASEDARQSRISLTQAGHARLAEIDVALKRIEKLALAGIDDKDRKRLRKLLRDVEKNLAALPSPDEEESLVEIPGEPAESAMS